MHSHHIALTSSIRWDTSMYTRCVSTGTFLRNEKPSVVRLVRCARSRRRCLCKFFNNFSIFCLSFLFVRFLPFDSAELKMDVLRERECKDSIERQLADERKLRGKSSILSLTRRIDMFKLDRPIYYFIICCRISCFEILYFNLHSTEYVSFGVVVVVSQFSSICWFKYWWAN